MMNPIHSTGVTPSPPLRSGVRALWASAVWAVFPLTGMAYIGVVAGMHHLYPDEIPGYLLRGGLYILGGWAVLAALLAMVWGLIRAARWWGLAVFICSAGALLLTALWYGGMPMVRAVALCAAALLPAGILVQRLLRMRCPKLSSAPEKERSLFSCAVSAVLPCMGIGVLGGLESLTLLVCGLITFCVCFLLHAVVLSVLGMYLLPERKPITPLRRVLFVPTAAFLTSIPMFFPCMCPYHYGDFLAFAPGFAPTAILFVVLVTENRALSNPPRPHA